MRLAWILLGGLPAILGQDLRLSPVSGAPGERVALEVLLNSPAGKAPLALQWETVFPAQLLDPEGNRPETGAAAKDSGKSVTCAVRKAYSLICVLAGGQKPITNGSIAIFYFRIRADARVGTSTFRTQAAEAATLDLKEIALEDAEGTLTVR
jgi:hypothetical protein